MDPWTETDMDIDMIETDMDSNTKTKTNTVDVVDTINGVTNVMVTTLCPRQCICPGVNGKRSM